MPMFDRHGKLRARLSPYIDGELKGHELAELNAHLETCDACTRELEVLHVASAALREMPEAEAPRSFALTPEMLAQPASPAAPPPMPRLQVGMRLASAAIALALVVVFVADNSAGGSDSGGPTNDDSAALEVGAPEADRAEDTAPSDTESLGMMAPIESGAEGQGETGAGGSSGGEYQSEDSGSAPAPEGNGNRDSSSQQPPVAATQPTAPPLAAAAPETPATDAGDGGAVDEGAPVAAESGDDSGLDWLRVAEAVLLAALVGTVGASIYLAIRGRRA